MLKINGFSDKPCFLTGKQSTTEVVSVKFADGSFSGTICWTSLLEVLRRKAAETPIAATKAEPKTGQTDQP